MLYHDHTHARMHTHNFTISTFFSLIFFTQHCICEYYSYVAVVCSFFVLYAIPFCANTPKYTYSTTSEDLGSLQLVLLVFFLGEHLTLFCRAYTQVWISGFWGAHMFSISRSVNRSPRPGFPITWCSRIPTCLSIHTQLSHPDNIYVCDNPKDYRKKSISPDYPLLCHKGLIHRSQWIDALIWRILHTDFMLFVQKYC